MVEPGLQRNQKSLRTRIPKRARLGRKRSPSLGALFEGSSAERANGVHRPVNLESDALNKKTQDDKATQSQQEQPCYACAGAGMDLRGERWIRCLGTGRIQAPHTTWDNE